MAVLALAACSDSKTPVAQQPASSASASSAPNKRTSPPFEVTRRDIKLEDTSRVTNAVPARGLPERPSRTLPLMILTPEGDGPFPLIAFSHGTTGTGPAYLETLEPIAEQGYVVIAPTFPLSSGPNGQFADYDNQPGDVYFSIDAVTKMASDPSDPLYNRVQTDNIGLMGHSLGAMTTIGAAYNSCCVRPTVKVAVSYAGIEAGFPNGDFTNRPPTPLLLVHGDKDTTIPISGSESLFAAATGPTAFLRYPDGSHTGILRDADDSVLTQTATLAWLDKWLRNDPTKLDALPAAVQSSGIANLQTKGF